MVKDAVLGFSLEARNSYLHSLIGRNSEGGERGGRLAWGRKYTNAISLCRWLILQLNNIYMADVIRKLMYEEDELAKCEQIS